MRQGDAVDTHALLSLWERGLALAWPAREALLAAADADPPRTVGAQRLRLIDALRRQLGDTLPLRCRCPACSAEMSFEVDLPLLLGALGAGELPAEARLDSGAWQVRFRLPAPLDIAAVDAAGDGEVFVQSLLERCVIDASEGSQRRTAAELPASLLAELSMRMEALDPAACVSFELACADCGHAWSAPFDPARALWSLLQDKAERLLLEVDRLAQRYGWSEDQILALTPTRRRAYLQLAHAG